MAKKDGVKPKDLQQAQKEVEAVVNIMRENVDKLHQREIDLATLDRTAESVKEYGELWKNYTRHVKKRVWWKNVKFLSAIACAALVIVIITLGTLTFYFIGDDGSSSTSKNNQTRNEVVQIIYNYKTGSQKNYV
ncbi:unnamed protein product [Brassicogethes aeneus]|uniref:V-SNARE coiled-coil homology domain-containing protein n=1 Tax=Brassicogethes aeneus TaxID=1431903 RepID=A0A9P0FBE1_BRAAE|nr:unnamed protein product [Brassicogethes aeneus]